MWAAAIFSSPLRTTPEWSETRIICHGRLRNDQGWWCLDVRARWAVSLKSRSSLTSQNMSLSLQLCTTATHASRRGAYGAPPRRLLVGFSVNKWSGFRSLTQRLACYCFLASMTRKNPYLGACLSPGNRPQTAAPFQPCAITFIKREAPDVASGLSVFFTSTCKQRHFLWRLTSSF